MTPRQLRRPGRLARSLLAALGVCVLLAPVAACGGGTAAKSVVVLGTWTGGEEQEFDAVLRDFESFSHVHAEYQGTRALDQVLRAGARENDAPDVVVTASPTQLLRSFQSGTLLSLDGVTPAPRYPARWRALTQASKGGGPAQRFALVVRADLKSIIWRNPRVTGSAVPTSWDELLAAANKASAEHGGAPWCMGMGAGSSSGFPGTDWIEDIVLHQSGPAIYAQWAAGALPWTSAPIETAWRTWGTVLAQARGGPTASLLTDFSDAGKPMFATPPGCLFDHEGSFITAFNEPGHTRQAVRDYDMFPFPRMNPAVGQPTEVSGSFAGMFHDTPGARALMAYLAQARGQEELVKDFRESSYSADATVGLDVYHDPLRRRIARTLTGEETTLCFDASDVMPDQMSAAFYQAVLRFVSDPRYWTDTSRLDTLLSQLDAQRAPAYAGNTPSPPC